MLSKPRVIPAALKSPKSDTPTSIYYELDPGRGAWIFPLENGMLPKDPNLVAQLCAVALEQFPQLKANCKQMEVKLLVFPLLPPDQVTQQCQIVQETLGCRHVDAAIQQVFTWGYWGRKTGLIVDIGYSVSFVTPIYRGFLLEEQVLPLVTGSFFVSAEIRKLLLHQAEIADSTQVDLYTQLAKDGSAISKIKQTICQVTPYEVDGYFDEIVRFQY
jgi:actin-related protein